MTKNQIIEKLTKIESFLLLSDDEIAKKSKVDVTCVNSYKLGWAGSAISSLIQEIKVKGIEGREIDG